MSIKFKVLAVTLICFLVLSVGAEAGILRNGDRGAAVEELQQNLELLGYNTSVDGIFGSGTEQALREFQKEAGLSVDGVYGNQTETTLQEELNNSTENIYTVQQGDTLTIIAINHGVSLNDLRIANNIDGSRIHPGDELVIPGENGNLTGQGGEESGIEEITHNVRNGEALSTIARQHDTDVATIREYNNISGDMIKAGDELVIPVNRDSSGNSSRSSGSNLSWPVDGNITSDYGNRRHPVTGRNDFHSGVDIAAPHGTKVQAAESGTVSFVGWMGGYGRVVIIDHGNGYETLYAHNSQLLVSDGQRVNRGSSIARIGTSGVATGPHVHFEIHSNGNHQNPMNFLR
ncbi:MAG: peptidoglycan DD-metalloendopeptidase family protein [Halarsenatibacteraceae bacterium]